MTDPIAIALVVFALMLGCCASGHASARTFGGYDCTGDCVGHAAGYRWAEERGIDDIDKCPDDRSEAFYEGCLTYVDDPERGADFDDDGRAIIIPRPAPLLSATAQHLRPPQPQHCSALLHVELFLGRPASLRDRKEVSLASRTTAAAIKLSSLFNRKRHVVDVAFNPR
jgi:hypothetical protein